MLRSLVGSEMCIRDSDYADDLLEPTNLVYQFESEAFQFDKSVDPNFRQNVMLIFKEAINNILKHTDSSEVKIKLYNSKDTFNMEIVNKFEIIHSPVISQGMGLRNMEYRATKIGGKVSFEKKPTIFKVHFMSKIFS